jgi:hypothetical protein
MCGAKTAVHKIKMKDVRSLRIESYIRFNKLLYGRFKII